MHQAVLQRSLERHTERAAKQGALSQSLPALTAFRLPAIPQESILHNYASVKLGQGVTWQPRKHSEPPATAEKSCQYVMTTDAT